MISAEARRYGDLRTAHEQLECACRMIWYAAVEGCEGNDARRQALFDAYNVCTETCGAIRDDIRAMEGGE